MVDKKKVLLTGAAGLVGSVLGKELADRYHITGIDRVPVHDLDSTVADLTDMPAILPAFQGVDAVVHLAADPRHTPDIWWDTLMPDNVIATANVEEDKDLILAALDLANSLNASIAQIKGTASNLAQSTTESEVISTVERLIRIAEGLNLDHAHLIETVREKGIVPRAKGYTPSQSPSFNLPFSEEPPIQDVRAASAV